MDEQMLEASVDVTETPAAEAPAPVADPEPVKEVVAEPEPEKALEAVPVPPEPMAPVPPGQRFLDAFGEKGGVWFAQGKSFEEAQDLYVKDLKSRNETLATRVREMEARLGALADRGSPSPVSASTESEAPEQATELARLVDVYMEKEGSDRQTAEQRARKIMAERRKLGR